MTAMTEPCDEEGIERDPMSSFHLPGKAASVLFLIIMSYEHRRSKYRCLIDIGPNTSENELELELELEWEILKAANLFYFYNITDIVDMSQL